MFWENLEFRVGNLVKSRHSRNPQIWNSCPTSWHGENLDSQDLPQLPTKSPPWNNDKVSSSKARKKLGSQTLCHSHSFVAAQAERLCLCDFRTVLVGENQASLFI